MKEDIIRIAREAGLSSSPEDDNAYWTADGIEELERFAALVRAAEREACAKVCEEVGNRDRDSHAWDAAAAIRARGQS
jgi:hypothetical protein